MVVSILLQDNSRTACSTKYQQKISWSMGLILVCLCMPILLMGQLTDRKQYTLDGSFWYSSQLVDIDGDGYKDYLVQNTESTTYVRGVGQSAFADLVPLSGTYLKYTLIAADWEGDGDTDLFGFESNSKDLIIHEQIAPNQFVVHRYDVTYPRDPSHLGVVDLDGDGVAEVYSCNASDAGLIIVTAGKDGAFKQDFYEAPGIRALTTGLDTEGPYVGIANQQNLQKITVDANGNFVTVTSPTQTKTAYLETADIDADGIDDIVFSTDFRGYVAHGVAGAAWASPIEIASVGGNRNVEIFDVNGDNKLDLVFGNFSLFEYTVAEQQADWLWESTEYDFPRKSYLSFKMTSPSDVIIDGELYSNILTDPSFNKTIFEGTRRILSTEIADLTQDGQPDIIYHADIQNKFHILEAIGSGHQQTTTLDPTFGNSSLVIEDLNSDDIPDVLFIEDNVLQSFTGLGGGAFSDASTLQTLSADNWYISGKADFDADGQEDLLIVSAGDAVSILYKQGSSYGAPVSIFIRPDTRERAFKFELVDIDLDNDIDVVAIDLYGGAELFRNSGPTNFSNEQFIARDRNLDDGLLLHINDDDYIDVALLVHPGNGSSYIELYESDGTNATKSGVVYTANPEGKGIATKDIDGDGLQDLILLETEANRIVAFFQRASGSWSSAVMLDEVSAPARMIQDENSDLVVVLAGYPNNSSLYTYDFSGRFEELEVRLIDAVCNDNGSLLIPSDDYRKVSLSAFLGNTSEDNYTVSIPTYNITATAVIGEETTIDLPAGSAGAGDVEAIISIGNETKTLLIPNSEACTDLGKLTDLDALMFIYRDNDGANWSDQFPFDQEGWRNLYNRYIAGNATFESKQHCGLTGVTCNGDGRVTNLSLTNIRMDGVLSDGIGILTELTGLNLSVNGLDGLTPALGNLTKLQVFAIANNRMSGTLPNELGNCTALEEIYLGLNQLSGPIPETFGQLTSLRVLLGNSGATTNTVFNKFTSLPESIGNCTALEELVMWRCNFEQPLPESIGNCSNLKILQIHEAYLPGEIPQSISNLRKLSMLNLSNNRLVGSLPDSLHLIKNPDLNFVFFSDNHLDGCIPPKYDVFCDIGFYITQNAAPWNWLQFCQNGQHSCGRDEDQDGVITPEDCDDSNPDIYPGATELYFTYDDENCDGETPYDCYDEITDYDKDVSEIANAVAACTYHEMHLTPTATSGGTLVADCTDDFEGGEVWLVTKARDEGILTLAIQPEGNAIAFAIYEVAALPITSSDDLTLLRCYGGQSLCDNQDYVGLDKQVPEDQQYANSCDDLYAGFLSPIETSPGKIYALHIRTEDNSAEPIGVRFCGNYSPPYSTIDCNRSFLIIDQDNDGWAAEDDCDDLDPEINPEAEEIGFNEVDEDCDGEIEQSCLNRDERPSAFDDAWYVCDKQPLSVEDWDTEPSETAIFNCEQALSNNGFNMSFLKFKIKEPGSLYFRLSSENEEKSIGFVVFQMEDNFDLESREQIRCIYSGMSQGFGTEECFQVTGLRPGETDTYESSACFADINGFGAAIDAEAGEEYMLVIRSWNLRGEPVLVDWCGTALLMDEEEGDVCTDPFTTTTRDLLSTNITLYPNPTLDKVYLEGADVQKLTYQLVSATGMRHALDYDSGSISVDHLAPGLYFITGLDDSGLVVWRERLVVE